MWNWPSWSWARIHIDYAGPFEGHYSLIIIDTHSKWIWSISAKSPFSSVTIELLCSVFAQLGLPQLVVSNNGSCFVIKSFNNFWSIMVLQQWISWKSCDNHEKRTKVTDGASKSRIAKVWFAYCNAPHCTTGSSPAKLLLGRKLCFRLDLMKPSMAAQIESKHSWTRSSVMTILYNLISLNLVNQSTY